jgi:tetratricopeptide (TPR) repeat protein
MMERTIFVLCLALLAGVAPLPRGAAAQPASGDAAARYERCISLARSNPTAGWERALAWRSDGGGHPAEHCAAVALIGLKQYREAGTRLEKLAQEMTEASAELRGDVLDQAGQAWLLAGNAARAEACLSQAMTLAPNDLDIVTDRATARGALGRNAEAIADLDRVIAADPRRADAFTYRAAANRALQRLDKALADANAALRLTPNSPDALLERGNVLRLKGDTAGARRDWIRVSELAPNSDADTAAKANIEKLDLKVEPEKPAKR